MLIICEFKVRTAINQNTMILTYMMHQSLQKQQYVTINDNLEDAQLIVVVNAW